MTYQADQFGLYLSLAVHGGVAVDFLDEDALQNSTVMAQYSVLFVTEPNVPGAERLRPGTDRAHSPDIGEHTKTLKSKRSWD